MSDAVGRLAPLNLIQRRSAAEQPELWGVYRALIILANGRVYGARYAGVKMEAPHSGPNQV